ncbi:MAG: hypothetical protein NTW97_04060 [Candidatus Krumholzibacteria bacterium]|nr:hypothetical protein [Candidatus Krumholzibacteria bacterium]
MRVIMLSLCAAIVALPGPVPAADYVYPGDRQWIYCAEHAEECYISCDNGYWVCPSLDTMFVFIRANDPVGVSRAHFRLEADYPCCDSIQAVIPCPGVVIESGDIRDGITISFPAFLSGHFKALALVLWHDGQDPPKYMGNYGFGIRDAWLERSNDETVPLSDYWTTGLYPDCYTTSLFWYHPDTMDVFIGSQTDVKIQWELDGAYYFGFYVSIADEQGWVNDFTPNGIWWTGCFTCIWHIETMHIFAELPGDVPAGTLSTLTITRQNGSPLRSFVLRAVPPVATEKQSWGKIKNLFK